MTRRPRRRAALRVIVAAAAVLSIVPLGSCGRGEPPPAPRPPRLLIVGWDGATFDMIDPLVAAGRLPCLAGLLRRGTSARLESTRIPISSAAWTAIVTGKGPGRTGVYGFFESVPGTYDVRLITSRSNRAAPLWRILSRRGLGVNVFGVPVTYPPEPVRGHLVAGMLSPFDAEYAYPSAYTDDLRGRGFVPDLGVWRQEQAAPLELLGAQLDLKADALVELLSRDDWSMSLVVFKSLDVASHREYTGFVDGTVADVYERLDEILARLIDTAGPNTNVLLISDHGFRAYPVGLNLHEWLVRSGDSVRRANVEAGRGDAAGTFARRQAEAYRDRIGELDMTRTRAFATVAEGNFGAIRLNVAGREPDGVVRPDDVDAVLDDLAARLAGFPGFVRAWRGRDLYPGPQQQVVPDLVVETEPDLHVFVRTGPRVRAPHRRPFPDHDLFGVLVAAGPSIAPVAARGRATVVDVAPTALHLLHTAVYEEMEGRVLTELLRDATAPLPARIRESEEFGEEPPPGEAADFSDAERGELEERLRSLGYAD